MSKILRITQKVFGSNPGTNQISKFGSLAAGSPGYTTDPAQAMGLSQWITGWFSAVIGGSSPAIEDLNAFCFASTNQLAYLFQAGVPEYDAGTSYYVNSIVQVSGVLYISLIDDNLGNATTDSSKWRLYSAEPTGSGRDFWGSTLPAGYVWASGKTIGSASSNATERANADTIQLYTLLWSSYTDSQMPMFTSTGLTSGRGTSAASDFAANKTISIPDKRGRVSVGADALGGTAASRIGAVVQAGIGSAGGSEQVTLTVAQMPSHNHGGGNHTHVEMFTYNNGGGTGITGYSGGGTSGDSVSSTEPSGTIIASNGGDGAHSNMQPTIVCNYILKL